ncbi:MAG: ankyrin repeat domain-containing protein, partial [Alphaproteobacteria bacterium]
MGHAQTGHKDNILILINNGADVNFLYNQVSPLTMALTNLTDKEVFEALLAHGSDVNYYGVDGNTPLMLASAYQSDPEVVKLLLAHGAKIDAINDEGQTALMFAVVSNPNPQV